MKWLFFIEAWARNSATTSCVFRTEQLASLLRVEKEVKNKEKEMARVSSVVFNCKERYQCELTVFNMYTDKYIQKYIQKCIYGSVYKHMFPSSVFVEDLE